MEASYAPPDHPVFELVPPAFHEHVSYAYSEIGQPKVNVDTFWEVYLSLRQQLRERHHEQVAEILTSYQQNREEDPGDVPLLSGMEEFRLGQPLDLGNNTCYIGGLDSPALPGGIHGLVGEYADFSESDNGSEDDS